MINQRAVVVSREVPASRHNAVEPFHLFDSDRRLDVGETIVVADTNVFLFDEKRNLKSSECASESD